MVYVQVSYATYVPERIVSCACDKCSFNGHSSWRSVNIEAYIPVLVSDVSLVHIHPGIGARSSKNKHTTTSTRQGSIGWGCDGIRISFLYG